MNIHRVFACRVRFLRDTMIDELLYMNSNFFEFFTSVSTGTFPLFPEDTGLFLAVFFLLVLEKWAFHSHLYSRGRLFFLGIK